MKRLIWLFALPWIVTWTYTSVDYAPCQPPEPRINPYSGEKEYSSTLYAVACYSTNRKLMSKEFNTQKEAKEFIGGCNDDRIFWAGGNRCEDIVIRGPL